MDKRILGGGKMSILDSIPDISFIGDISVEKLKEIGINEYKSALSEITGETVTQISDDLHYRRSEKMLLLFLSGQELPEKAETFILQQANMRKYFREICMLTFYVLQQTAAVLQIIMKSGNFRH